MRKGRWDWDECRKAIHRVDLLVQANRYVTTEKALQGMKDLGHDSSDIAECLNPIDEAEVTAFEKDRDCDEKHVLIMKHRVDSDTVYVKVSLRLEKDYDLVVLSYHRPER